MTKKHLRRSLRAAAALAVLAAAACDGSAKEAAAAGVISRQRFIAANVALRSIPDTSAKADSLRAEVLKKSRVTEKELRAYVRAQRDPKAMADVWEEIAQAVEKESAKQDSIYRANHPEPEKSPDTLVAPHGGLLINPRTGEPASGIDIVPPPSATPRGEPPRPRTKDPRYRLPDRPRDTRPWVPPPAELRRDSAAATAPPPPPPAAPAQP